MSRIVENAFTANLDYTGMSALSDDPNPTLGGDLNTNGYTIYAPPGQNVILSSDAWPAADGAAGTFLETNGLGVLTWAHVPSGSITWVAIAANTTLAISTGYFCTGGAAISLALPAVSAIGDTIEIVLAGSTSFTVTQTAGQRIRLGNRQTTAGIGGSMSSLAQGDSVRMVCLVPDLTWLCVAGTIGNLLLV